ncbi:MAG: phosphatase PAP2 family protein [Gemmatirosa sp.]
MPSSAPLAPFRPAAALLAAYLVATLPPAVRAIASAAGPPATPLLSFALAALLGAALWTLRTGHRSVSRVTRALAAWLPLLAVPACYAALPLVAAGLGRAALHDPLVIDWEQTLFGASPARTLAERWPARALSELLHLGYLSYYALIYLPPAWLWWRAARDAHDARGVRAFAAATWTVWLAFVACYLVFAWLPVQGPWYQWPAPGAVPDGPVRGVVEALLRAGSSRGTAFPSSHVAVSVAQTLALLQVAPRLAVPTAIATTLLAVGAVYGGFHYAVDVLAGAALGALIGAVGPRLHARLTRG